MEPEPDRMSLSPVHLAGLAYLDAMTTLLQAIRCADPQAGLYEAADIQWWWREDCTAIAENQVFWQSQSDEFVAALILFHEGREWHCDLVSLPDIHVEWQAEILEQAVSSQGLRRLKVLSISPFARMTH